MSEQINDETPLDALREIMLDKSLQLGESEAALNEMIRRGVVRPDWAQHLLDAIFAEQDGDNPYWELTVAKSALENWGRHHPWCASRQSSSRLCDCGLTETIARIDRFLSDDTRAASRSVGSPSDPTSTEE